MTAPHEQPPRPGPAADLAARLASLLPVLEAGRVRLRAPTLADFPAWTEILCSPRALHLDGPFDRDGAFGEFAASVAGWLLRGHGIWTVEPITGGEALGFVLLGFEPGDHEPELGFMFRESAEGRGLAQEAALAARDWGWSHGLPSMVSYIDPDNARSVALAERLGARRDGAAEAAYDGTPDEGILVYRYPRPEAA